MRKTSSPASRLNCRNLDSLRSISAGLRLKHLREGAGRYTVQSRLVTSKGFTEHIRRNRQWISFAQSVATDPSPMSSRIPRWRQREGSTASPRGNRERIQVFQGDVIRRHGHNVRETFTVRRSTSPLALSVPSQCIPPRCDKVKSPSGAMSVAPSCTTCATKGGPRLPRSREVLPLSLHRQCNFKNPSSLGIGGFFR